MIFFPNLSTFWHMNIIQSARYLPKEFKQNDYLKFKRFCHICICNSWDFIFSNKNIECQKTDYMLCVNAHKVHIMHKHVVSINMFAFTCRGKCTVCTVCRYLYRVCRLALGKVVFIHLHVYAFCKLCVGGEWV